MSAPVLKVGKLATTRYCWMGCSFCRLSIASSNVPIHEAPNALSQELIAARLSLSKTVDFLKLRGGLTVKEPFQYWLQLIRWLRSQTSATIAAFSAVEIWQFHIRENLSLRDLLSQLRWSGAALLGPGGSETFDHHLRHQWSPYRMTSEEWALVAKSANDIGFSVAGSIMVYPGIPEQSVALHLDHLAPLSLRHIEVKPFIAEGTELAAMGQPHLFDLVMVINQIRQRFPETDIYVPLQHSNADLRLILTAAGANAFLDTIWEIAP